MLVWFHPETSSYLHIDLVFPNAGLGIKHLRNLKTDSAAREMRGVSGQLTDEQLTQGREIG